MFFHGHARRAFHYELVRFGIDVSDLVQVGVALIREQAGIVTGAQRIRLGDGAVAVGILLVDLALCIVETVDSGHPVGIKGQRDRTGFIGLEQDEVISDSEIREGHAIRAFGDKLSVRGENRYLDVCFAVVRDREAAGGCCPGRDGDAEVEFVEQIDAIEDSAPTGEASEVLEGHKSFFSKLADAGDAEAGRLERSVRRQLLLICRRHIVQQSGPQPVVFGVIAVEIHLDERIDRFVCIQAVQILLDCEDRVEDRYAVPSVGRHGLGEDHDVFERRLQDSKSSLEFFGGAGFVAVRQGYGLLNGIIQVGLVDRASIVGAIVLTSFGESVDEDGHVGAVVCRGNRCRKVFQSRRESGVRNVDRGQHGRRRAVAFMADVLHQDLRHLLRGHVRGDGGEEFLIRKGRALRIGLGFRNHDHFRASGHLRRHIFRTEQTVVEDDDRHVAFFLQERGDFRYRQGGLPSGIRRAVHAQGAVLHAVVPHDEAVVLGIGLILRPVHEPFQRGDRGRVELAPGFPVHRDGFARTVGDLSDAGVGPDGIPLVLAAERQQVDKRGLVPVDEDIDVDLRIQIGLLHGDQVVQRIRIQIVVRGHVDHVGPLRPRRFRQTDRNVIRTEAAGDRRIHGQAVVACAEPVQTDLGARSRKNDRIVRVADDVFQAVPVASVVGEADLGRGGTGLVQRQLERVFLRRNALDGGADAQVRERS